MSTDIYIYAGMDEHEDLWRDGLQDAVLGLLGSAGRFTGGGSGEDGFNVDLALADGEDLELWVGRILELLRQMGAAPSTYFEIFPPDWKPGMPHRRVEVSGEDRWLTV